MPTREYFFEKIEQELATAREAQSAGNNGKARVCARRAAGVAITWYLTRFTDKKWEQDALRQLLRLRDDDTFPQEVRQAAQRLATKISDQFRYPFSTDPLRDAQIIISYIASITNAETS